MTNTSATGGPLLPEPPPASGPLQDDALADFFQAILVGLTALDPTMVRPKWQTEAPNHPGVGIDWIALGVDVQDSDSYAFIEHVGAADGGNGADVFERHEQLHVICSFYGPNAGAYASQVSDGLLIAQNRDALTQAGMGLTDAGKPHRIPDFLNELWYPRVDLTLVIKRCVRRIYPILNLLSADGTLYGDGSNLITSPFTVTN